MMPSEIMIVDKLPLLGSGKPDLRTLQKIVQRAGGGKGYCSGIDLAGATKPSR